jgi:hypothetical protein
LRHGRRLSEPPLWPRSPTSSAFRRDRATAPFPTPRRRPKCWSI